MPKRKKLFLLGAVVMAVPAVLVSLLVFLLYLPPFQNWAVDKAALYASEQTGMDISIDRVRLRFSLDLAVDGIRVIKHDAAGEGANDTIADIRSVVVDVRLSRLLGGKVAVEALEIDDAKVNTAGFIADAQIKGYLKKFAVESREIDFGRQTAEISDAMISGGRISVELADSVAPDTTASEPVFWKIMARQLVVSDTDLKLIMPGDTMSVAARFGLASVRDVMCDLGKGEYRVANFGVAGSRLAYDIDTAPHTGGFDYNHIDLNSLTLGIDTLSYGPQGLALGVKYCAFKDEGGLAVTRLEGPFMMDSLRIRVPSLELRTPSSTVTGMFEMDMNTFDDTDPGRMVADLKASVGKHDVMLFCDSMPENFTRRYPDRPIVFRGVVSGNMRRMDIDRFDLRLETAFRMSADGYVENAADFGNMKAEIATQTRTGDLNFIKGLLPEDMTATVGVPSNVTIDGNVKVDKGYYAADLFARKDSGSIDIKGFFDSKAMVYKAEMSLVDVDLHQFLPQDSLYEITATLTADGAGTDIFSPATRLEAKGDISKLIYGSRNIGNIAVEAAFRRNAGHVGIAGDNRLLSGSARLDAVTRNRIISATLTSDIGKLDMKELRLSEVPFVASFCSHLDLQTDLNEYHKVEGEISDMVFKTEKKTFRPPRLVVDMRTGTDSTWAKVRSGSFDMGMAMSGGYNALSDRLGLISDELKRQKEEKIIDQPRLLGLLPVINVRMSSSTENPVANYLKMRGISFADFSAEISMSPEEGINGQGHLYGLKTSDMKLDTVTVRLTQDENKQLNLSARVENNRKNPQFVFKALVDGFVIGNRIGLGLKYYDAAGKLGMSLATRAEMKDSGIIVHAYPCEAVVGYKHFNINPDNYILLARNQRISANIDVLAADGEGVKIYSNDEDETTRQDITVSLNRIDLGKVTSVLPYAPRLTGLLNGDFRMIQDNSGNLSMLSDLAVSSMTFENSPVGNMSSEFVYLLNEDSTHMLDMRINNNGHDVGLLKGVYVAGDMGHIDASFDMDRLPLALANGLLPQDMLSVRGYADGKLSIKGPLSKPVVDGELFLDSSYVDSHSFGVTMRFDNDPVRIVGSRLLLENLNLYASNNSALNLYGKIDFANLDNIRMDMKMRARDYLLVDARKTSSSVAYGKAFVNFYGQMNGSLDDLDFQGKLDVLGKTDMTYVLKDSPLNTGDQLKELVTFTDFTDTTTQVAVTRPPLTGMNIQMMISVEQGARIMCALNADQSNYVELEGGGELRFSYDTTDDMKLFGRYTLNGGKMKYSLPVIPLKTFSIAGGSYIEFTGDVMNPRLNLTATEQVKALVSDEGSGANRSVLFDCGVKVSKTLNDMGLEFTLDAPEDMTMRNKLVTMSPEERGKIAVTMLTTGMFLADGNTSGFSMNNALNSFLQSEINNITNKARSTVDISVGLDQGADAAGQTYTDYSFKFAKRFWNNRINIVIGGKISDANKSNMSNQDNTFLDNVSLEYRLDQTAMRYVKLFYDKEADDLLEENVSEYGAGFVWRKKMSKLNELFKSNKRIMRESMMQNNDSIKTDDKKK